MYGKSIFDMIIGWADRSSAFSSPCVWNGLGMDGGAGLIIKACIRGA